MTIILIKAALAVVAAYCGLSWLNAAVAVWSKQRPPSMELTTYTFYLGLCFILAVGFLGVIGG